MKGKGKGKGIRKAKQQQYSFDQHHVFSKERNGKLGIIHYFSSLGNKERYTVASNPSHTQREKERESQGTPAMP